MFQQASKSFRPDFVLVRQAPRDGAKDYRSTLLGFKFGGVPTINSLNSLLLFQASRVHKLFLRFHSMLHASTMKITRSISWLFVIMRAIVWLNFLLK